MKLRILGVVIVLLVFAPVGTLAQSLKNIAVPEFTRSLSLGLRGNDVKSLQEFLASDPEIYPEGLTTGYFGLKTQIAVKKWQQKHDIEPVGIVGPKTIAKIKEVGLTMISPSAPSTEPTPNTPQANTATATSPTVTNDTTPPTATLTLRPAAPTKIYIQVNPSEEVTALYEYGLNTNYGSTQPVDTQYFSSSTGTYIESLISSTVYHVRVKVTDRAGNIGYSQNYRFATPSLSQAPIISYGPNVSISTATPSTSVAVSWETNIPCVGAVYYGGTTALGSVVRINNTDTSHSAVITGLSPGAIYLYKITCATTSKTLESDNFMFIATSSSPFGVNNFSLSSIIETLNGILEKMKILIK